MVESIKELRKICYKGSDKKRPLYMELFTMKISIYVTKLFLYTPIRADHVSMLMILLVFLGYGLIAYGSLWIMFLGITLIHFSVVLDNVNGEVARYRKEGSLTGSFLEELYHTISTPLIFFSFGYGIFRHTSIEIAILFGFLSAIFSSPVVLTAIKTAVVKKGMDRLRNKRGMLPKKYTISKSEVNVKGGSTYAGKKLYSFYDIVKELWGFPANIAHIHIIIAIELLNNYNSFMAPFTLSFFYIVLYATVSALRQLISFIVHYRGKTIFHYYNALFGKK